MSKFSTTVPRIYRARSIRFIDGDTLILEIDLGFNITIVETFRLLHVDTPERGEIGFDEAKNKLIDLCYQQEKDGGYLMIKTHKTGKFGRWLAEIEGVTPTMHDLWPYDGM